MKNLLTEHPSADVRRAALSLLDALCTWERTTGRENVVIIKDSIGCQYRSFSGAPQPEDIPDIQILEAFESILESQHAGGDDDFPENSPSIRNYRH